MGYIHMDSIQGFHTQHFNKLRKMEKRGLIGTHLVIIRVPDSWILKLILRLAILAIVVVSCPWIGSMIGGFRSSLNDNGASISDSGAEFGSLNVDSLPLIFRDLSNEGLMKTGDRAVLLTNGDEEAIYNSGIMSNNEIDLVSHSDSERQSLIPDFTFDLIFTSGFQNSEAFIHRTLKIGGIVVVQLSSDPLHAFPNPANYKITYLRRFDSTIVALRKTQESNSNSRTRRRLFGFVPEAKKAALKNLENVLLEPPRSASGKSKSYKKRTKFLPDLMRDSLDSYSRRVFIEIGTSESADNVKWFENNYPTKNKEFEIYKVEATATEAREILAAIEMSEWLKRTVREEEFVVMRAEAEVVEEMVKSKVIGLVDELFMECKNQGLTGKTERSKRAYWECLALYGRLRDEGVAVHQWWG